ncbi:alpha/beta fold hydrolase [Nocardia halotolerans]|uniref:Alpha/beta fold hydrolase n=1 Tax=Nocardia halotolerans TaxID=1755878 RepID=A0ABV8VEJ4_9NOCA
MTTAQIAHSEEVRPITLRAGAMKMSALLSRPISGAPRATVVALHGTGMTAAYFDGQASPDVSLLASGARLGYAVLAVDRPGYGRFRSRPQGRSLTAQARALRLALVDFAATQDIGAGVLLLGHSFGGMLALRAAERGLGSVPLLGVDVSGCGHRPDPYIHEFRDVRRRALRSWGPPRLYPPSTFRDSAAIVAPVPPLELGIALRWPMIFPRLAAKVTVPVRFTFAEHESLWRHDPDTLRDLASHFSSAHPVSVERAPGAGHNISLGWAASSYHLRCFGFLEKCLDRRTGQADMEAVL